MQPILLSTYPAESIRDVTGKIFGSIDPPMSKRNEIRSIAETQEQKRLDDLHCGTNLVRLSQRRGDMYDTVHTRHSPTSHDSSEHVPASHGRRYNAGGLQMRSGIRLSLQPCAFTHSVSAGSCAWRVVHQALYLYVE